MLFGAKTDIGCVRSGNEDSYGYSVPEDHGYAFFAVADGMGGHKAGEIASHLAASTVIEHFDRHIVSLEDPDKICYELRAAVEKANTAVWQAAHSDVEKRGMGTTLVCVCVTAERLIVVNAGDSRAYLISGKAGSQLTVDHSLVEHLIQTGRLNRQEAKSHPRRNEITRALGADAEIQEDLFLYDYRPGDVLLLCSDGLTKMVEDADIFRIASDSRNPQKICDRLVELAKKNGGTDNITVIAAIL